MKKTIKKSTILLSTLFVLSFFGAIAGSNEPIISLFKNTPIEPIFYALHIGNEIIFNLSIGYIVSLFFWFMVVYIPEEKKRRVIKRNLERQYKYFKIGTIQNLLLAANGSYDSDLPEQLCDYERFKEYFTENGRQKWYDALNGLEDNKNLLNDLIVELSHFADEISYVLNKINIEEDKVHSFFKNLTSHVYNLKNSSVFYDDHVKYLGRFLYGILAQFDLIEGQKEEDIIQLMIDGI